MNQLLLQVMADQFNNEQANLSEVVLGENEIICSLTNRVVKATDKELTLQSMINMMTEEYDFAPSDMERDFKVKYEDVDEGKTKNQKVDLAIFEEGRAHDVANLVRVIIVAKDAKVQKIRRMVYQHPLKAYYASQIVNLAAGQMEKTYNISTLLKMHLVRQLLNLSQTFLLMVKPWKTSKHKVNVQCLVSRQMNLW